LRNPLRQRHAPPHDSDQRQVFRSAAFLHDFMRQPLQRAVNFGADINWLFSTMRMVGVSYHSDRARSIRSAIIEP